MKRTPDQALFIVIDKPMPTPEQDEKRYIALRKQFRTIITKWLKSGEDSMNWRKRLKIIELGVKMDAVKARQKSRGKG